MIDASHPFTALLRDAAIVDVRSPGEFAKGAVFGAVNIPLFSNDERAEIGILYRQLGREPAIRRGLATVGGRLSPFVSAFERFRGQPLVVYCARGGMRSQSVVALLAALGYSVRQLQGGYKAYRNYLLAELEHTVPQHLIVIHGETGVGKTELLNRLPNALDLEGAAQHRSSLFGGVNREPRTQQQFEADLLHRLQGLDRSLPVWIEGESRKVGAVTIPEALRRAMAGATCVLVTASLETRVTRIIAEYTGQSDTAGLDAATLSQLEAALGALRGFFGAARTESLLAQLRAGKLRPLVRTLLEEHYDPRYRHAMRHYTYALTVSSEDLDAAAKQLAAFGESAEMNNGTAEPQMTEGPKTTAKPQIAQIGAD
ncbi:MAG: tRNA 2-selenouridine(34) synthase MnmH [SAR324 cluster bacterium]